MTLFSKSMYHPISEIVTSHVCRLKKTRNEGDQKLHVFLIKKRVRVHSIIKFWVSNDLLLPVRSEIMKYIKNRSKSPHFMVWYFDKIKSFSCWFICYFWKKIICFVLHVAHGDPIFAQVGPKIVIFRGFSNFFSELLDSS